MNSISQDALYQKPKHKPLGFLVVIIFSLLLFSGGLVGCTPEVAVVQTTPAGGYPNDGLLASANWLSDHLNDPNLRVIDMREFDQYEEAHVPGAVHVVVDDITATVDGIPFEFDRDEVSRILNRIGLRPEMTVVVYDNLGMMSSGRLFMTLEYVGHADVRVLHGGWNAWEAEVRPTSSQIPEITPTDYPLDLQDDILVSAQEVLAKLDDPDVVILDARSPQEYTGEKKLSDRGGHIPGARNLVWLDTLMGGDAAYTTQLNWQRQLQDADIEYFKPPDQLQSILADLGVTEDQQVITYCQTLWRGAHLYLLLRLMGFEDVRGYDGSWAEWGEDPDLPVVTGPEPGQYQNNGSE